MYLQQNLNMKTLGPTLIILYLIHAGGVGVVPPSKQVDDSSNLDYARIWHKSQSGSPRFLCSKHQPILSRYQCNNNKQRVHVHDSGLFHALWLPIKICFALFKVGFFFSP